MLRTHPSIMLAIAKEAKRSEPEVERSRNVKPHRSFEEQLDLLKERGLIIENKGEMLGLLERIGYYHLSGYMLTLRNEGDTFCPGTTSLTLLRLYSFDHRLRMMLRDVLDRVEINFRTQVSYTHTEAHGTLGYYDKTTFIKSFDHEKYLNDIASEIFRQRRLPFIKHHLLEYGGDFPLWVVMEISSFGTVSKLFSGMLPEDKRTIAKYYGEDFHTLQSWARCLSELRNNCAHQNRLYNKLFTSIPSRIDGAALLETSGAGRYDARRLFWQLIPIYRMLPTTQLRDMFVRDLRSCLRDYASYIQLEHIGFPENWNDYFA